MLFVNNEGPLPHVYVPQQKSIAHSLLLKL